MQRADLEAVADLVEAGRVSVGVARTCPLERAAEAQEFRARGHRGGKVILEVGRPASPARARASR
jgi:NADPH:quinone reductase-like Zn-dependent oxidoreductase